jgi:hypothetical protein
VTTSGTSLAGDLVHGSIDAFLLVRLVLGARYGQSKRSIAAARFSSSSAGSFRAENRGHAHLRCHALSSTDFSCSHGIGRNHLATYAFFVGRLGGKAFEHKPWLSLVVALAIVSVVSRVIEITRRMVKWGQSYLGGKES